MLACRREQLVGAAICESWNDADGIVVQLAVDPGERFEPLGRALLLAAFARMRERGIETVVVPVGGDARPDAAGAVRVGRAAAGVAADDLAQAAR